MSREDLRHRLQQFFSEHRVLGCLLLCALVFASLVVVWSFLLFSGLNTSADFVYNQF